VLTTGLTFFGLAHQRSMTAMEEAMQNKAAARQNAVERERALRAIQAERALQEANEQK
jgi:hypothetical protein